jgi:diketogulonate reductase-like aldo/keto reductase
VQSTGHKIGEQFKVFHFSLNDDDMTRLDSLDCGLKASWDSSDVP